jgi:hypothetical protein
MIGRPGQVAVIFTTEAQRHLTTLAGEAGTTLWPNQVAPRGLLQMMALADQFRFLHEHLHTSPRVA